MPLGIELRYRGVHPKAIRGLFHGKQIQHGYQCVDKGKRPRTRRDWKPNVQYKHLFSEALQCQVKVCVTTYALKRIDRAGGLDMYLLTTPAASRGSIVADELRKNIVKEYQFTKQGFPQKEGHTSILSLVDQRLRDAGLRPQFSPRKSPVTTLDSSLDNAAAASETPSASTSSTHATMIGSSISGSGAPDTLQDIWKPIVRVPHQDEPYRIRSERKTAIINHILEKQGFSEVLSPGSVLNRSELAHARRLATRKLKSLNRNQLIQKLPKASRKQLKRSLEMTKRLSLLHRRSFSKDLSSGKRVSKPLLEAVRKAKMEWRRKISRRNNLVATNRGQARNEMLKRIASSPEAAMFLRFAWLQTFVQEMPAGPGKEAWRALAEKYQPSTPGMLIDGVFIPATNRDGVTTVKHPELPSIFPPALSPQATLSPEDQAHSATAEDILRAANAVAFLPASSQLLVKDTTEKMDEVGKLHKWQDLQVQQHHADKLYQLMRDMKLQSPRYADAIERRIKFKLKSLGSAIDSLAGITGAYAKHHGINGTMRVLIQATAANSPLITLGGNSTSGGAIGATPDGGSVSGAPAGDANQLNAAGLDANSTSAGGSSGSSDSTKMTASGAKGKGSKGERSAGGVRRMINTRMTYTQRRKLKKMRKWLDDVWLRQHVVYDTLPHRLVLGNGMTLPARSRRQAMPDALWEELNGALQRIEEEVVQSPLSAPEPPGGWSLNARIDSLEGLGRFTTLPGVPGSWVPS